MGKVIIATIKEYGSNARMWEEPAGHLYKFREPTKDGYTASTLTVEPIPDDVTEAQALESSRAVVNYFNATIRPNGGELPREVVSVRIEEREGL